MDETTVRAVVVAAVLAAALGWAWFARRGRAVRRRPTRFDGMAPGVVLFTSRTCTSCAAARRVMRETVGDRGFREVAYEDDPGSFRRLGIGRVPTVASIGPDGTGWTAQGIPGKRSLRRWLGGP